MSSIARRLGVCAARTATSRVTASAATSTAPLRSAATASSRQLSTRSRVLVSSTPQAHDPHKSPAPPTPKPTEPVTPLTEKVRDFLEPSDFYALLKERGMDFYAGVPDSLLSDFCAYVTDASPDGKHVITANEGAAVGLAAGYYLATRQFPIVYMQNSGFGNAVNPLLSLCDPKVYSIPMLLLIGWRGEPGKKDEPQHLVQGKVMSSLLASLNIQFEILPDYIEGAREAIDLAVNYLEKRSGPYAFLVKRQTFMPYQLQNVEPNLYSLNREEALALCIDGTSSYDVLVTTTGFTSREVYEIRERNGQDHRREFLTVGSMGHASVIALGIAIAKPQRQVFCLDGDGAMLMHMGSVATIGRTIPCKNFKHILINNGSHDSVGGQPTRGFDVDFSAIAKASGYQHIFRAKTAEEIKEAMTKLRECEGPAFLEVFVNKGARKNLGRPKTTPVQNKTEFMRFLA